MLIRDIRLAVRKEIYSDVCIDLNRFIGRCHLQDYSSGKILVELEKRISRYGVKRKVKK